MEYGSKQQKVDHAIELQTNMDGTYNLFIIVTVTMGGRTLNSIKRKYLNLTAGEAACFSSYYLRVGVEE